MSTFAYTVKPVLQMYVTFQGNSLIWSH